MTAKDVQTALRKVADRKKALLLQRFFKTGPGEYGEGDVFAGVMVPQSRKVAREFESLPFVEIGRLIRSPVHEERLVALLILVARYENGSARDRERIYGFYLRNTRYINNWDLVDLTAGHIVGAHLRDRSRKDMDRLSLSAALWERRIAVVATCEFIRHGEFGSTLRIARRLMNDREDLIHKAVGWMLREVGKRDLGAEEAFLRKHAHQMPRTMLRYAIERFPEQKRQRYLAAGKRISQSTEPCIHDVAHWI